MKCSFDGCEKQAILNTEKEKHLCCCEEHFKLLDEYLEEREAEALIELYNDWKYSQIGGLV